jgi:deoxyribodipyrimidine photo-lyase
MSKSADSPVVVFWFRRDLRVDDNRGLYEATKLGLPILPIFIFDTTILSKLKPTDRRVGFIHHSLIQLENDLGEGSLNVFVGNPVEVFQSLLKSHTVKAIVANEDYEPYAQVRDSAVQDLAQSKGIPFMACKDQVIFAKNEIVKDDGDPYRKFTPYARRWLTEFESGRRAKSSESNPVKAFPSAQVRKNLAPAKGSKIPSLKDLGFQDLDLNWEQLFPRRISTKTLKEYGKRRNFPAERGTSRLGVHLRFGTLSIRKLVMIARADSKDFLNELIWREFFMQLLFHYPKTVNEPFDPRYTKVEWRNKKDEFSRWCEGVTGVPIVDAGMRELVQTGFMHNRVRMIVGSFLTKHLLIDWRWGERFFAEHLMDFELSANVGNWQWVAGSGCDAAPYFRIFNPEIQAKKFDPKGEYIKKWVPELGSAAYPEPIVAHEEARRRALMTLQRALARG